MNLLMLIFIPLFFLTMSFSIGYNLLVISRWNNTILKSIVVGAVVAMGAFYLLSTPFMLFQMDFMPLYMLVLGICILSVLLTIFLLYRRKKEVGDYIRILNSKIESLSKLEFVFLLAMMVLIAVQIVMVVCLQHTDIDDSYYLAEINTFLHTGKIMTIDAPSGLSDAAFSAQYSLVSFELLQAVISKLFGVNAAFLAHTIWPIFPIMLHYLVIYLLCRRINRDRAISFSFLYLLINIFGGYSIYSQGSFLLYRSWQGKTIFIDILVPVLILMFLRFQDQKICWQDLAFLYLLMLAALSTTTVAIYLAPIAYFILFVGFLITKRQILEAAKLTLPIIGIMPWVIIKFCMIMGTGFASSGQANVADAVGKGAEEITYAGELIDRFMMGDIRVLCLFGVSLLIIMILGSKKEKAVFFWPVLALFVSFLNPLLMAFIARNVTGTDVYWRLFWLLEIPFVIADAAYVIVGKMKSLRDELLSLTGAGLVIVLFGGCIFISGDFVKPSNPYKLYQTSVDIVDDIQADLSDINKEATVLLPLELSYDVREYCGNLILPINRYSETSYQATKKPEDYELLDNGLNKPLYGGGEVHQKEIEALLSYFSVDYLVLYKDRKYKEKFYRNLVAIGEYPHYLGNVVLYKIVDE